MKKIIASVLLSCLFLPALLAQQKNEPLPKISASTRAYLNSCKNVADKDKFIPDYVYKIINNKHYLSAMIKVNNGFDQAPLTAIGVFVGTKAGNIWTTQIPVDKLEDFIRITGIQYIELDAPVFPVLDSARRQTKADSAQMGIFLPMPMTGKNVVTGIVDAGFDFNHPTFYDTSHGGYRIRKVWTQKIAGTPPAGFAYGNELTDSFAIRARGYDTAITSHGSHVAGITAGSGHDSIPGGRFRGMAFESDIVLVAIMPPPSQWINTGVSDIVDGINYIYTYAASVSKPAVVNLSWGSTLGPHDGSSLFSQACDALTGAGKLFVCAAGNNGQDTVHLQKVFSPVDTTVQTFVTFSPYLDTNNQSTYVDVWGDPGNTFCLKTTLYNVSAPVDSTGFICLANDTTLNYYLIGSNSDTCFVTITTVPVDFNSKPHAYIYYHSKVHDNICLTTKATAGTVNMWEGFLLPPTGYYGAFKKLGYPFAVSGDVNMTVSDIGSTKSAITVGAYNSKVSFKNISGATYGYTGAIKGKIASFSSFGPTEDNRIKPDITAPGLGVVSAISSYDPLFTPTGADYTSVIAGYTEPSNSRTYRWAILAGTSMASPCVSGIVAMMLQLNPTLTPDSAKSIIRLTAITDAFTGVLPTAGTNTWGHGKINAYKALRYMVGNLSVQHVNMDQMECILYPNPGKGNFTIDYTSKVQEQLSVEVYDINGKLVFSQPWHVVPGANSKQLNLSNLAKGIYLTRVSSQTGFSVIKTIHQ